MVIYLLYNSILFIYRVGNFDDYEVGKLKM
jgi:hypothetical protein